MTKRLTVFKVSTLAGKMINIFRKKKQPDINEPIPFCMRCFHAGAVAGENPYDNFCHMCGSQGTCVSMKRRDFIYLTENIQYAIQDAYQKGLDNGTKLVTTNFKNKRRIFNGY